MPKKKQQIKVSDTLITIQTINDSDYICITDMVRKEDEPDQIIRNWLRSINTLEYLAAWETLYNPDFKPVEFDRFRAKAGTSRFTLSVTKWVEGTGAIGILSKRGKGGGTYAHKDIAFHFGENISPMFHLLLIREFQRLKEYESRHKELEWNANRFLTKRNYRLQTEAIKNNLLPRHDREPDQEWITYAEEADLLNVALFGMTAKAWKIKNPEKVKKGENIRDHASNIQLIVLSNLEAINSELIREAVAKEERFYRLQQAAVFQLGIFYRDKKMLE